jgi:hypothetical protein
MGRKIKPIEIKLGKDADLRRAEEVGLDWLGGDAEVVNVSWYDRSRRTGGPMEVCGGEPIKCAIDYAVAHGASERIVTERFDLFYVQIPPGTASLDPEMVVEVHRGLERDRYENQQGG